MPSILLLDLDHTLYPSTAPTLPAVDGRITLYIERRLGLSNDLADRVRREFCAEYGTTLRGLEVLHGVDRGEYMDFIQDLDDALLPPPHPALRDWLIAAARRLPAYVFTNARRDWADRCLAALGVADLFLPNDGKPPVMGGILDIDFMDWIGKPDPGAFERVERFVRARHGEAAEMLFADDRLDNLAAARARGWRTIWVRPHDTENGAGAEAGHRIVHGLTDLDPDSL